MICPNCNNHSILFHNKLWSIENGTVYKCESCDLVFIDPMMSEEEEKEFYNNYNEHVKQRGMTVENNIEEFHLKSKAIAQERYEVVKEYFQNKKVLEVGSSTGAFLELLDNCQTSACELTPENKEYSKQFITNKAYSSIDEVDTNDFDIICMFHVFEHIRDPKSFLLKCKKLLNKDGAIIIEVPHCEDPLITIFNCEEFKDFVFQPMHPMVYGKKSLDYIFKESGLKSEDIIYYQRYGLDNHLSWFKNKKAGGDTYLRELFGNLSDYKNVFQSIGKTDTIFYIAKDDNE